MSQGWKANRRRRTVPSWVGIVLAAAAILWLCRITGPYGLTEVGQWTFVAAIGYLLLMMFVAPVLLAVRGLNWFKRDAANRRSDLQRRFDARVCTECGYDLRTLPDRCPECGAPREKWWA